MINKINDNYKYSERVGVTALREIAKGDIITIKDDWGMCRQWWL